MDNFIDYYELLHVQPSAPEPVIKASYRTMMQKLNHHPDRGGDVGFAQLLNNAVKTLCDPETRAKYDALRQQFRSSSAAPVDGRPARRDSWGEPGGSPTPSKDNDNTEPQPAGQKTGNSQSQTDSTSNNDDQQGRGYTSLPSRAQCPFCLSVYPFDSTPMATPTGYAGTRRCNSCNGARTHIAQLPRTSNEELRKMHRQHHETQAQLFPAWPCGAPLSSVLSDFSPAGCALVYSKTINIGQTVMIETGLFNAICTVRHCKPLTEQGYLIGLEFVTLDMIASPGTLLNATA